MVGPGSATSTITYGDVMLPRSLAIGPDRTLYVGDDQLGLLAIPGIGGEATVPDGTAPPATPVPGRASYTG